MSSETITRNDLTNILNEVLPFSFTDYIYYSGSGKSVPSVTITSAHTETFSSGAWLVITKAILSSGGNASYKAQNRITKDGSLVNAVDIYNTNGFGAVNTIFITSASNTTVGFDLYQSNTVSETFSWEFVAVKVGDKYSEPRADYIVEQGTSGIWTYRKWNSGVAECWGDTGIVTLSSYGTEFGGKGFTTVVTFPTGLFASTPQVTYSAHINNNWALTGTVVNSNTSTTTFSLYAISATSVTTNTPTEWWVSAKGKWK